MQKENYIHLITLSYKITKKHSSFISFDERVKYICEHIVVDNRKIIFDITGEGLFGINLVVSVIKYLGLKGSQLKIICSVDPLEKLKEYNYTIDYTGFCNWFNFYRLLQEKNYNYYNIKPKYYFVALAHRPSINRAMYVKDILDNFKEQSLVSFGFNGSANKEIQKILDPYKLPLIIDYYSESTELSGLDMHEPPSIEILQALFNIVLETNEVNNKEVFITEKSFKPFAWHQIPIFVAPKGHTDKLRELGFDLFDDLLDNHSYNESHPNIYKLKILSLMRTITKKYNMIELRKNIWNRLSYNNTILSKYVERDIHVW